MLSEYSKLIINQTMGDLTVNRYLSMKNLQQLYQFLENQSYLVQNVTMKQCKKSFPNNEFISRPLHKKTNQYNKGLQLNWLLTVDKNKIHKNKIHCSLIFYSTSYDKINPKLIQSLVDCVSFIASFSNQCNHYKIHFVPLDDKKKINPSTKSLTKHMINSGCSYKSGEEFVISCWRLEEYMKVIFHECIHSFIPHKEHANKKLLEKYKNRYQLISQQINFEESFVEVWARIIHCYYVSHLYPVNIPYQYFCSLLSVEHQYAIQQSFKLRHLKEKHQLDLDQHTNVTSYYLISAEILQDLNSFLSFTKGFDYFNLTDSERLYSFLNQLKKIKLKKNKKKDNSLRMTAIQLK